MIAFIYFILFILLCYLLRKFGLLDVAHFIKQNIHSILLIIIIILMLTPDMIKNWLFFNFQFDTLYTGVPTEIITKCKSMLVIEPHKETILDVPAILADQLNILSSLDQKMSEANNIGKAQLQSYYNGQTVELQKIDILNNNLSSLKTDLNYQTKVLTNTINHPKDVINTLTSIKSNTAYNPAMLKQLTQTNLLLDQSNKIDLQGFSELLKAEGKQNLAIQLENYGKQVEQAMKAYENKTNNLLQTMKDTFTSEELKVREQAAQAIKDAQLEAEISRTNAQKAIEESTRMINEREMYTNLGIEKTIPNTGDRQVNAEDAAKVSLLGATLLAMRKLIFKF